MTALKYVVAGILLSIVLVAAACYVWLKSEGLNARKKPSDLEYKIANFAMEASIPGTAKTMKNPVPTAGEIPEARRLYSDNCAVCHGNDGKGMTDTAKGLSPEVPDLHAQHVQKLTDGEIFYIIRHGVRFTGMPGWDFPDEQVWKLVSLIRQMGTSPGR